MLLALESSRAAFERPALALLHRQHAPVVVALLRTLFGAAPEPVLVEDLHAAVDALRDRMLGAGDEDLPAGQSGREWCRSWVAAGWLLRDNRAGSDDQVYTLTASAREAIDYVQRATALRGAGLSESRIRTILDTARRAAGDAAPDRRSRLEDLDRQIEALTAERERLAAGGDVEVASPERMHEAYLNLAGLLQSLPADFQRVAETETVNRRGLIQQFRLDDRGAGDVLSDYLDAGDRMLASTPEGRAFMGALDLLQSEEAMDTLRSDLQRVLAHDFAAALDAAEQREFRTAVDRIASSLAVVQRERHRTSAVIRRYVQDRAITDRAALAAALDRAAAAAERWIAATTPRAPVPEAAAPLGRVWAARLEIGNLRQRLHPLGARAAPAPLHTDDPGAPAGRRASRAELLSLGGPSLPALRRLLRGIADRDPGADAWTLPRYSRRRTTPTSGRSTSSGC